MPAEVTSENFESEVLKSETPVIVDFWAQWCGPCKMLGPIFEELSGDYEGKLKFVKLNVDDAQDIAQQFGVMSIPTMVVFSKGAEVDRLVGALPKDQLKQNIDKALEKA